MFIRVIRSRPLISLLVTVVALLGFNACLSINEGSGNIGITGPGSALFTIHGNLSNVISSVYTSSCNYDFTCLSSHTANQSGNDFISNEALTDCNPADQGYPLCGYDETNAILNRDFTCPGGPFCNSGYFDWQTRCLEFEVDDSSPITGILDGNLNGAYFHYGSWTWYRQGNGNCVES